MITNILHIMANHIKKAQEACYYHPDVKAYNHCEICGLPICPACINEIIINGERKIVCKECLSTIRSRKAFPLINNTTVSLQEEHKTRTVRGYKLSLGNIIGLGIELTILALIARAIVNIAMKKEITSWTDVWDIVNVVLLAFIFWLIIFYAIKKLKRKAPRIIKKVE